MTFSTPRDVRLPVGYPALVAGDYELHSVARAELHEDLRHVRLDGEWAEVKRLSNLGVGQAGGDQAENFAFPGRQLAQAVMLGPG